MTPVRFGMKFTSLMYRFRRFGKILTNRVNRSINHGREFLLFADNETNELNRFRERWRGARAHDPAWLTGWECSNGRKLPVDVKSPSTVKIVVLARHLLQIYACDK
jgi:hypothetical protein